MKIALCHLQSVSPYSQSRPIRDKKDRNETSEAHEQRTWRERLHVDKNGEVFIPPMAFKNCISQAAVYKAIKIPGKGQSTYTKHFDSGVMCKEPMPLKILAVDVESEDIFVPSDGKRGGGKRVWKTFPIIREWSGVAEFVILDDIIDKDVFATHLVDAGQFIGLGRFRPRNNGYYGRFAVKKIDWREM